MRRPLRHLLLLLLPGAIALGALGASSCVEGEHACYRLDWRACSCAGGGEGYQQCDKEGAGYGACDCSGRIPGLTTSTAAGGGQGGGGGAGGGGGGAGGGGGKLPFMSECMIDEECETGLCYFFNAKGPHCSSYCGADADCPPPSPGCNNMGVCKAP